MEQEEIKTTEATNVQEDKPYVVANIKALKDAGTYPDKLWE